MEEFHASLLMLHVNLQVLCAVLSLARKLSSSFLVPVQMPSMYTRGWRGSWARKALSNLSMNRLGYEGAILVPIAVPWICS